MGFAVDGDKERGETVRERQPEADTFPKNLNERRASSMLGAIAAMDLDGSFPDEGMDELLATVLAKVPFGQDERLAPAQLATGAKSATSLEQPFGNHETGAGSKVGRPTCCLWLEANPLDPRPRSGL